MYQIGFYVVPCVIERREQFFRTACIVVNLPVTAQLAVLTPMLDEALDILNRNAQENSDFMGTGGLKTRLEPPQMLREGSCSLIPCLS